MHEEFRIHVSQGTSFRRRVPRVLLSGTPPRRSSASAAVDARGVDFSSPRNRHGLPGVLRPFGVLQWEVVSVRGSQAAIVAGASGLPVAFAGHELSIGSDWRHVQGSPVARFPLRASPSHLPGVFHPGDTHGIFPFRGLTSSRAGLPLGRPCPSFPWLDTLPCRAGQSRNSYRCGSGRLRRFHRTCQAFVRVVRFAPSVSRKRAPVTAASRAAGHLGFPRSVADVPKDHADLAPYVERSGLAPSGRATTCAACSRPVARTSSSPSPLAVPPSYRAFASSRCRDSARAHWNPRVEARVEALWSGAGLTPLAAQKHLSWVSRPPGIDRSGLAADFAAGSPLALGRAARAVPEPQGFEASSCDGPALRPFRLALLGFFPFRHGRAC